MKVPVVENVLKLNDEIAAMNRQRFREAGVFSLDLIGSPGCGKTALLERTLERCRDDLRIGIVVGDLATTRDAERLARFSDAVVQINTGKSCHLEAHQVRQSVDQLELGKLDVLIIENVGNMICPVGYDLGQDLKVGMFSITDGDDKAAKHPHLVHVSNLILLNKMDLLPHVPFDRELFDTDVKQLNPEAPVLEVAALGGDIEPWVAWLKDQCAGRREPTSGGA